jgi:hypothetical protein
VRSLLVVLVLIAAACGDDAEGVAYEPLRPATAEEFFELLPVARCQQLVRCGVFEAMDSCVRNIGTNTRERGWIPRPDQTPYDLRWRMAAAREAVHFSPGDAALCLASFGRGSCSRTNDALTDTTVCLGVFRGTIPTGEPSSFPHECESFTWGLSGPHCNYALECCSVPCADDGSLPQPFPPFDPAAPCDGDDACGAGSSCHDGYCMRGVAEGEACADSADCWSSLICRGGRCVEATPPADECLPSSQFPTYECDRFGSFCNRGVCKPLGGRGDFCDRGLLPCQFDLVCDSTSQCASPPGLGEPCADLCADGLACWRAPLENGTTCRTPTPAGSSCTDAAPCEHGYCVDGDPVPVCGSGAAPMCAGV